MNDHTSYSLTISPGLLHDAASSLPRIITGSLFRFRSSAFLDVFADDLRVEGVVRTSELSDARYPVIAAGSFVVTVESPFYALHSLRIRVEGDWIGDVWFAPFEDLLSRRFVARAFVCDDAVEYVVADLLFDAVPDAIGLIISMAMAANVPPGFVIEVLDTPPVAASTAPRCMQCGEQFDHQGARIIGRLLGRPVPSVFAITCAAHHPALALIPKEICHA